MLRYCWVGPESHNLSWSHVSFSWADPYIICIYHMSQHVNKSSCLSDISAHGRTSAECIANKYCIASCDGIYILMMSSTEYILTALMSTILTNWGVCCKYLGENYRRISNIRYAPNQKIKMFFVPSCSCFCPIHWSQLLSREWRCSWSSAVRLCFNYIWVINNFTAH